MLTLAGQVQRASDSAKFGAARLTGSVAPSFEDNEATIDELLDRCARTISYLRDLAPDAFTDCETRTVTFGGAASKRTLVGAEYLLTFALPNFFFHVATAYDVLRHEGVPIGKRDYLGLTKAIGPDSDVSWPLYVFGAAIQRRKFESLQFKSD